MKSAIETVLKMMPIWFGICFLGPVLAEIYLRAPVGGYLSLNAESSQIYMACMVFSGIYGFIAWRIGRWI